MGYTKYKKAEMGVGTLIVFIAMLLVAAVAAGVLIQTVMSLQEKSLSTGQQAKTQISTHARVIEVSASNGKNGNLTDFQELLKLAPGSDPIKLSQVIFTFTTKDRTSTLKYRGANSVCHKNNTDGYNTWNKEVLPELEDFRGRDTSEGIGKLINTVPRDTEVDLDDDGNKDYVWICGENQANCPAPYNQSDNVLVFNLSTDGLLYVYVYNDNGSAVNFRVSGTGGALNISHQKIGGYGYISAYRTSCDTANVISSNDPPAGTAYFRIFENPYTLEEDYDDDGQDDHFAVNDTNGILFLSSGKTYTIGFGKDITSGPVDISNSTSFNDGTEGIATVSIYANTTKANYVPAGSITITPYHYGEGYFSVTYEQEGTNHVDGNLQRGDIVKLCFESPGEIPEDSEIRLKLIPKIGTPSLVDFYTPDVVSTERVYLYP